MMGHYKVAEHALVKYLASFELARRSIPARWHTSVSTRALFFPDAAGAPLPPMPSSSSTPPEHR